MHSFEKIFKIEKPIIGMCHLKSLPDEPLYNKELGIDYIVKNAKKDVEILQNEGIHGILFSNEFSFPYSQNVSQITVATMARIIGELRSAIKVPFGVDCMYDVYSTIDLAIATDADFYRITLKSCSSYDFEFGFTPLGEYKRYEVKRTNGIMGIINVTASVESSFQNGSTIQLLKTINKQTPSYALCMSAKTINKICQTYINDFQELIKKPKILCDGGCNINNIENILRYTNGVIIGTAIKENRELNNSVSAANVRDIVQFHNTLT